MQGVGLLVLSACLLTLPVGYRSFDAILAVAASDSMSPAAYLFLLVPILGWGVPILAAIILILKKRLGAIALAVAAVVQLTVGGPLFVPLIGSFQPQSWNAIAFTNFATVAVALFAAHWVTHSPES
jgi:hypothetical protein